MSTSPKHWTLLCVLALVSAFAILSVRAVFASGPRLFERAPQAPQPDTRARQEPATGPTGRQEVRHSDDAAFERSGAALPLGHTGLRIAVVDDSGQAVAGAFVQALFGTGAGRSVECDEHGLARLNVERSAEGSASELLAVSAFGYSPRVVRLQRAPGTQPQVVVMRRGAGLRIELVDAHDQPLADARVRVSVPFDRLMSEDATRPSTDRLTSGRQRDWLTKRLRPTFEGHAPREWLSITDVGGIASFVDLPCEVQLDIDVESSGLVVANASRTALESSATDRTLRVRVPGTGTLRGKVVDRAGNALAGLELVLAEAALGEPRALFEPGIEGLASTTTSADGGFEFERVLAGSFHVGPSGESDSPHGRGPFESHEAPAAGQLVQVRAGETAQIELVVDLGLRIQGMVVGPDGSPMGSASVIAMLENGSGRRRATTRDDGIFELGPLPAGDYLVNASKSGCGCSGTTVRVAAGESVLIELVETRTLRVRATHANSGAPAFIEELLLSATDDTARSIKPRNAHTSELSIEGVRPGTYHALVRTIDGSVGLQVIEVAPSEFTAPEMTLEVEPGARLALDNSSGDVPVVARVRTAGGELLDSVAVRARESVDLLIPAGRTSVECDAGSGRVDLGRVDSVAGALTRLELNKR